MNELEDSKPEGGEKEAEAVPEEKPAEGGGPDGVFLGLRFVQPKPLIVPAGVMPGRYKNLQLVKDEPPRLQFVWCNSKGVERQMLTRVPFGAPTAVMARWLREIADRIEADARA